MRVLQSFRSGRETTNPYLLQLVASLPEPVEVATFSWRAALLGDWQVFHLHWPEVLLRGTSPAKTAARRFLFALLLLRVRLTGRVIVRTMHNESAHEAQAPLDRLLTRRAERATTVWIRLNPFTVPPTTAPVVTILHGDYARWYADHVVGDRVRGRVLYFGLVRAYKGVEDLIDAFRAQPDPELSLTIAGRPADASLARQLGLRAAGDPRIRLALDYLGDAELATELGRSELVVLPYRRMHNSGATILALSLGRPVLVPANDVTRALRAEVGERWVQLFEGELDADDLTRALQAVRAIAADQRPDLGARDWDAIGRQHRDAYRLALDTRVGRRA
ncbi:glycosyltransferase [Galbitalea soli]|uniref:GDP-mannose--glycolipid 4-beta-D-mannosyltransferase n=1 Tax=Galbitalea soli TaxID=1268042 RepID=A0A7C9PL31_9MICO|nr:GDP-mannose--glycolipid 4-beta-D-mannosyltransferase [Galbitalea soli]NEM89972.1 GDP-mannose--glycolipid 4-beta-D-mannosyltransferase [Galbitalea soli]NYJ30678.1 beta-1,4-mannosyltransferase [Galbitalea soli]